MARKKPRKKTKHKPVKLDWPEAIVELRARKGWTVRALAKKMKVWHPTIVRWENEQRTPRTFLRDALEKMMVTVNVTPIWPE